MSSRLESLKLRFKLIARSLLAIFRDPYGAAGSAIFLFMVAIALLAPYLPIPDPGSIDFPKFLPPSHSHPFGTDYLGRDVLSRVIWGARVSLSVGLIAAGISAAIGILLGAIAGFFGGLTDNVVNSLIEIFLMMPTFFLVLVIVAIFGSNLFYIMIVIGLTTWPVTARIMRAQTMSVKEMLFVEAARALGADSKRLLFLHVMPISIYPAIANTILSIGNAIMIEAALSYLGLGDPNLPSWGRIIYEGQPYVTSAWWIALFPGVFLVLTVLSINFIGDAFMRLYSPGLREA